MGLFNFIRKAVTGFSEDNFELITANVAFIYQYVDNYYSKRFEYISDKRVFIAFINLKWYVDNKVYSLDEIRQWTERSINLLTDLDDSFSSRNLQDVLSLAYQVQGLSFLEKFKDNEYLRKQIPKQLMDNLSKTEQAIRKRLYSAHPAKVESQLHNGYILLIDAIMKDSKYEEYRERFHVVETPSQELFFHNFTLHKDFYTTTLYTDDEPIYQKNGKEIQFSDYDLAYNLAGIVGEE